MGRIKRGYVREIPDDELKRDYRLFAIACEGSKDGAKGRIASKISASRSSIGFNQFSLSS